LSNSAINLQQKNESVSSLFSLSLSLISHSIRNSITITNLRRIDGRTFPLGRTSPDYDSSIKRKKIIIQTYNQDITRLRFKYKKKENHYSNIQSNKEKNRQNTSRNKSRSPSNSTYFN